jgi:hypothetical protein
MQRLAVAAVLVFAVAAKADEGMWPLNLYPVDAVQKKYGVKIPQALLDKAMHASVRFNNGGSGSFVSKDGLVMTNHHVAEHCIQQLGNEKGAANLMLDGFASKSMADEKKCPDLELNVLQKISDVTAKVEAAAKDAKTDADKNTARKAEMSKIEKACADETKMRCDVVTLYGGGVYNLYTYKKYTDVRLAFAPEFQAAFYGGDPDNFTFPRDDLDVAFFRVYESDKPAAVPDWFTFSARGPQDGDTVFVSGHPGSTDRFTVYAKLELLRDVVYPAYVDRFAALTATLKKYAAKGDKEERAAHADIFGMENSIKALKGYLGGLQDKELMSQFKKKQDELIVKVNALTDKAEKDRLVEAWPKLEKAYNGYKAYAKPLMVTEGRMGPNGELFGIARALVRLADEMPKKSEDRLREYRDSNLPSVELQLFSDAPIDNGVEIEKVAWGLDNMRTVLSKDNRDVKKALGGKEPHARAEEVVGGSKLADVAMRKAIYERIKKGEGKAALDEAKDPMIELARSYDKRARDIRKQQEDEVEAAERTYNGRIAEAMGKVYGTSVYPDATFTLRISTGQVKGYTENGKKIPWATRFGDLYTKSKRNGNKAPYDLAKHFAERVSDVDFSVPLNFVSTNDIIGGNSGSPVWNQNGQVVGLIFDGNIQSLPNRFVYDEKAARAVSVTSNGILHALDRVYGAKRLVDELVPVSGTGE